VPVRLYAAARAFHVAFHEIHKKCGTRVHQQLYCPHDKEVVSRDEIAMGYEVDKDRYILVDPAELKKLQPPSSTAMEILQFVKLSEVDPVYFNTSYFSVPEAAGERAYALLLQAMTHMDYAAIAKASMHQREHTVIIRPYQNGLIVHTIYYPNEIHEAQGYGKTTVKNLTKQEIDLAGQFAKALVKPFRPELFHDTYAERVHQLIESKTAGRPAPRAESGKRLAPVIDLMTALKKSLEGEKKSARTAKPRKLGKTA
jgi:DNA end-binding protein Ku